MTAPPLVDCVVWSHLSAVIIMVVKILLAYTVYLVNCVQSAFLLYVKCSSVLLQSIVMSYVNCGDNR